MVVRTDQDNLRVNKCKIDLVAHFVGELLPNGQCVLAVVKPVRRAEEHQPLGAGLRRLSELSNFLEVCVCKCLVVSRLVER